MNKIITIIISLALIFGLCACNEVPDSGDVILSSDVTTKDISKLCGHKSSDGTEHSYDEVLKAIYKKEVKWDEYYYKDIKNTQYTKVNLDTAEYEKHDFKSEYDYKIVHVEDNNGVKTDIIFAYDKDLKKVVACVDESRNIESWFLYEKAFCELNCKCTL